MSYANELLADLPDQERDALRLRYEGIGMIYPEIAIRMDVSVGRVRRLVSDGMRKVAVFVESGDRLPQR